MKPTRILSRIVERNEPRKSYLMNELERRLTPISEGKIVLLKNNSTDNNYFINIPSAQIGPLNALHLQSQLYPSYFSKHVPLFKHGLDSQRPTHPVVTP